MPVQGHTLKLLLSILFTLLLVGCSSTIWNRQSPPTPEHTGMVVGAVGGAVVGAASGGAGIGIGAAMGGILGGVIGGAFSSHHVRTLVEKLQYNGVQVVQVGDEIELLLPTDRFYMSHSPQLNVMYYPVLNLVGKFIRQFQKINVKVAGYTDNVGSWRRNLVLSKERARNMIIYLWNYGIDTRLLFAVGYGEKYPISSNKTARGRALNNRIVISLRKIENNDS